MLEILTLVAVFLGPISAVFVTRWIDGLREDKQRRMEVFKTLMRTRRTPIYPEHVGALNLIEIEFAKENLVIKAWKSLFEHLGTEHIRRIDEQESDGLSPELISVRNQKFYDRLAQERQSLLAKLLHAMAKSLNFKVEQLEIFEGGYTPQGWVDVEHAQYVARQFIMDLYQGKRVIPVGVLDYVQMQKNQEQDNSD